ncbi:hypothetical protein [Natronococcus roseus]|uniref:hypothetical protein n=1 Tax=Natronococcus roseus TaxID=1052014 RepID=UPI00374D102E
MSKIGSMIEEVDGGFEEWLEDTLAVRNYTDEADGGEGRNEYGNPTSGDDAGPTLDSLEEFTGQVEPARQPTYYKRSYGFDSEVNAEILIDDDAPVGVADEGREYPTEIEGPDGTIYRTVHTEDEGNGRVRVFVEIVSEARATE